MISITAASISLWTITLTLLCFTIKIQCIAAPSQLHSEINALLHTRNTTHRCITISFTHITSEINTLHYNTTNQPLLHHYIHSPNHHQTIRSSSSMGCYFSKYFSFRILKNFSLSLSINRAGKVSGNAFSFTSPALSIRRLAIKIYSIL